MEITNSTFDELKNLGEGLTIVGHNNSQEWMNGILGDLITNEVVKEGTTTDQLWSGAYFTVSTGGRNDLTLPFTEDYHEYCDLGKLAMWRIGWSGTVSWTSDFLDNYADHYQ